jgi:hypothetical protein
MLFLSFTGLMRIQVEDKSAQNFLNYKTIIQSDLVLCGLFIHEYAIETHTFYRTCPLIYGYHWSF